MAGYDITNPKDNDIISQYPPNERAQRAAVASAIGVEHDTAGAGRHKFPTGDTSARDAITGMNEGTLFVNTSAGAGNYYIEIYASATSVWETTGRFTSADEVKLDAVISAASATSAAAVSAVSSTFMMWSPYLIGVAIGANVSAAVQSDQETGTTNTAFVTPAVAQYHPSAAKAWVYFTVSGGTVTKQDSFNVSSVTDNSAGDYTPTFTTAFSNTNYAVVLNIQATTAVIPYEGSVKVAGACQVVSLNTGGTAVDVPSFSAVFFGDQ